MPNKETEYQKRNRKYCKSEWKINPVETCLGRVLGQGWVEIESGF